ncbi:hypothetical protein GCM10027093_68660 [Paraburkholderia jirisanensis]
MEISKDDFLFGSRPVQIEKLKRSDVSVFLADDWEKFDKHVKNEPNVFTGTIQSIDWYLQITPPFPTYWPPRQTRSVVYYAYAEYQELLRHGPMLSRSAPWAKVVLNEGRPADKVILETRIGPVVHAEGSVPISGEQAQRKIQIIKDGEAHLSSFVSWKSIPDDDAEVNAIKDYYCQWILTNRTADLIRDSHRAFFEWLSCPPSTTVPVLSPR